MSVQSTHKCLSSYLMTSLIDFRNFEGSRANWTYEDPIEIPFSFQVRKVVAELGAALIGIVAVIEAVVYGILLIVSVPVIVRLEEGREGPQSVKFIVRISKSSWRVIKWAKTILYKNLTEYNIDSREPFYIFFDDNLNSEVTSFRYESQRTETIQGKWRQIDRLRTEIITNLQSEGALKDEIIALHQGGITALRLGKEIQVAQAIAICHSKCDRLQLQCVGLETRITRLISQIETLEGPQRFPENEMPAFTFISSFMNLPQNGLLKANLLSESSPEAHQLFLFLAVKELLLSDWEESRLSWFCQTAQNSLRQRAQNAEWMQYLRKANQSGHLEYTLDTFRELIASGIDSIQDVERREAVKGLQEVATRALLGSPLLNRGLMRYLYQCRT